jgi:iron complex outermembrane receptor protein
MQHTTRAAALCAALSANALANPSLLPPAEFTLDEIVVTATRIPTPDFTAPYASEVHTRKQITQSGASTLYDYLAGHSLTQLMPSYGNRFSQLIDMRGYGLESGYESVVVVVDGRRLNNIDGVPQLLSAIPLSSIERIEIAKGSGAVAFGDGAMAGVIQIHTRPHQGVSLSADAGNFGTRNGTVTAGVSSGIVHLSASADFSRSGGYSEADASGHKDAALNRNQHIKLALTPSERLSVYAEGANTHIDTHYVNPITQDQFNTNPATASDTYPNQIVNVGSVSVGLDLALSSNWRMGASVGREDKFSQYISPSWNNTYTYDTEHFDLLAAYDTGRLAVRLGIQGTDGARYAASNTTRKDNRGVFFTGQVGTGDWTWSAGARHEKIDYAYVPNTGTALFADEHLNSWDVGGNWQLSQTRSLFGNLVRSIQTPNVDRFFDYGGTFNGLIDSAKATTLTLGLNQQLAGHRLKAAVYRSNLKDEIYYDAATWVNTNIDKSHKYGVELQDTWKISDAVALTSNYAYTRAKIDRENLGGGTYDGKDLPGVPQHTLALGLNWKLAPKSSLNLSTIWRSGSFAMSDFDNNNGQKQAPYRRTDLTYRVDASGVEWFVAIENLFEQKNGVWAGDNAIYPVSFTRNWRLGMKAAL